MAFSVVRVQRWGLLILLFAVGLWSFQGIATAQSRASIAVSDVQIIAEGPDQSIFTITLAPRAGSYSADNSDPSRPALILLGAARSNDLRTDVEYRGLVGKPNKPRRHGQSHARF